MPSRQVNNLEKRIRYIRDVERYLDLLIIDYKSIIDRDDNNTTTKFNYNLIYTYEGNSYVYIY